MDAALASLTGLPSRRGEARDENGRTISFSFLFFFLLLLVLVVVAVVAQLYRCMSICVELHGALGVSLRLLFFVTEAVVFLGLAVNLRVCGAIFFLATRPWRTARCLRQQRAAERISATTLLPLLAPVLLTFVLLLLFLFVSSLCRFRGGKKKLRW